MSLAACVFSLSCAFFLPLPKKNQFAALGAPKKETSQIEGPSLNNTYGFKVSVENLQEAKSLHEVTSHDCYMSLYKIIIYQANYILAEIKHLFLLGPYMT